MTAVLLDTQAALWLLEGSARLGPRSRALLAAQRVFVSVVSLWEAETKRAAGKLALADDLAASLAGSGVGELALSWAHAAAYPVADLPQRDPFDHMLVAQAKVAGLTFLTADRQILAATLPFVRDARE